MIIVCLQVEVDQMVRYMHINLHTREYMYALINVPIGVQHILDPSWEINSFSSVSSRTFPQYLTCYVNLPLLDFAPKEEVHPITNTYFLLVSQCVCESLSGCNVAIRLDFTSC